MNDKNDKNDIKKQVLLLFVVELCVCYWPDLEEEFLLFETRHFCVSIFTERRLWVCVSIIV